MSSPARHALQNGSLKLLNDKSTLMSAPEFFHVNIGSDRALFRDRNVAEPDGHPLSQLYDPPAYRASSSATLLPTASLTDFLSQQASHASQKSRTSLFSLLYRSSCLIML